MAGGGKNRGRLLIGIALILILVLVAAYFLYFRGILSPASQTVPLTQGEVPAVEMVNIVITTQPISRGTMITTDVLTTIAYPRSELVEGTFITDMTQVVGKRAAIDLPARTPLTPSLVIDAPTGSMASFQVPAGMTAFTIPISRFSAVAYALQPGDHVMIVGCMLLTDLDQEFQTNLPNYTSTFLIPGASEAGTSATAVITTQGDLSRQGRVEIDPNINQAVYVVPSEQTPRPRLVCQTVISDATVLQMGYFPLNGQLPQAGTTTTTTTTAAVEGEAAPVYPDMVTLIVTPQDSVMLTYMESSSINLTMALRGAGDLQTISTQSVTLQYILDQRNVQIPARLPYGISTRIDALEYP